MMKMAKLSSICTLFTDGDWIESKDQSDSGIRLIQTGNIGEGCFLEKEGKEKYISRDTFERLKCEEVFSGDILISRLPEPVGRACIIPNKHERMITAVDCSICRVDETLVTKEYLCYFLQSRSYYQQLQNDVAGTTRKRISRKNLGEVEIHIPTFEVQRKVTDILDKVTVIIEGRKQEMQALDNLIKSRFVEMFGEPMTNSKGYELKTYGELFELNAGGTPSKQKPEYWDAGTISWIGSNMCQNAVIYENDGNYITEEGLRHSSARVFPIDTVLVALVGATIGKTALLKFATTTNQNVLGIRGIREKGFVPEFVFYYTQGLYQKFLNIGDGGFAMASKGFISELPMPIVELSLQEQFADFVVRVDKLKFWNTKNNRYTIYKGVNGVGN